MSTDSSIRILFVDDNKLILDGLRRQFRRARPEWDTRFAESGREALAILEQYPADVVVSDMKMPVMSGAELLKSVKDKWPSMHRVILSGQTDQSCLLEHIGAIHRYLQKPCDAGQIISSIEQSLRLRNNLLSAQLESTIACIESLPVMNSVYSDLVDAINNEVSNIDSVASIVAKDPGLSVKVMQLVNSAFFCLPSRISTITDAVHRIGLRNLKTMAVTIRLFDSLDTGDLRNNSLSSIWSACAEIGARAEALAKAHKQSSDVCTQANMAGLLTLIGRAVLSSIEPDRMLLAISKAETESIPLYQAELDVFGASHNTVGAYALGIWAFDDILSDAVLWQADPFIRMNVDIGHPAIYVHAARSLQTPSKLVEPIRFNESGLVSAGFDMRFLRDLEKAA
ncbi:MAG: HDOD domain-containing protein [Phycisphaera sp.]|nr:MAG: HDOD domain-containing protein [Phycisphaera sp.]